MRSTIKLFKVFGISIEMHVTFLILPVLFGLMLGVKGIVLILGVFVLVTFHELCHALQAKRFGIKVERVILLPIGGIASMNSIPENPLQEFKIAIAGPLFNLILAVIFYYPMYMILGREIFFSLGLSSWPHMLAYLYWLNVMMAVFNLLPAFPMDGGRILRALLTRTMTLRKATRIAVTFGYFFILLFVFWGFLSGNIWLLVIAFFVYVAAAQEASQVDLAEALKRFIVKDILPDQFLTVSPETKLSKVLEMIFHSHQEDFPVVEGGNLVGMITRVEIMTSIHKFGLDKEAGDVMIKNFITAAPADSLVNIHKLMNEAGLRAIPILEAGRLAGIVTVEDLGKVYLVTHYSA
ncbi:MAG: site-2 protease family protein [Candidatus Omnitrophota bacterium]